MVCVDTMQHSGDGRMVCHRNIVRKWFPIVVCRTTSFFFLFTTNLHENFIKSQSHFEYVCIISHVSTVKADPVRFCFFRSFFFIFYFQFQNTFGDGALIRLTIWTNGWNFSVLCGAVWQMNSRRKLKCES